MSEKSGIVQCSLERQRHYLPLFLHKAVLEIFNFQLTGTLESHTLFLTPFIDKRKEINDCPKELRKTQTEKYNSLFEPNLLKMTLSSTESFNTESNINLTAEDKKKHFTISISF
jgi:hypothetical protein